MLGIPTVLDRIIQQAIHRQLNVLYDPLFSESSYGFRPHRSAHDAVKQASKFVQEGNCWVVDIDMAKYFDTIPHDRLMQRLSKGIGDKKLLRLINQYLKAGLRIMESIIKFIEGKLKLKVNRDKSGVRLCEDVTYLGYTIGQDGRIRVSNNLANSVACLRCLGNWSYQNKPAGALHITDRDTGLRALILNCALLWDWSGLLNKVSGH